MKKNKKPLIKTKTRSERNVRIKSSVSGSDTICWQFSLMDMEGSFSCKNISYDDWKLILNKMREWETMTWDEISGKRDHAIDVDSLSPEAKKRLIEIQLDDIDEVFSLHLDGKKRLFGIRDRNIFRVLWWDKEHKVCPSLKKHT